MSNYPDDIACYRKTCQGEDCSRRLEGFEGPFCERCEDREERKQQRIEDLEDAISALEVDCEERADKILEFEGEIEEAQIEIEKLEKQLEDLR